MKQITVMLITFVIFISGCTQADKPEIINPEGNINIVCTTFPQYDWVRQIIGHKADNIALTLLLDNGVDIHNYQPTVDDIVKISRCDLFIYIGGESDKWVEDIANNPNMKIINLLEVLGEKAKTEEIVEGMEEEPAHGEAEDYKSGHENSHEEETEYDEHVWLSLKNAELFCHVITDTLSSLDPQSAGEYKKNLDAYTEKLMALDREYQELVNTAPVKHLLFGDRFPFRYLVDDYGLEYYAAFPGCYAETAASFETIIFLAGKMDELNLNTVMTTESTEQSIAKAVISNTKNKNQQILSLDSMQSVRESKISSYLSIMEYNLNVLKEALK